MARTKAAQDDQPEETPVEDIQPADDFTPPIEDVTTQKARRLFVSRGYQGARSGEEFIRPGAYFEDDPALHRLAEYLVENQYGWWL